MRTPKFYTSPKAHRAAATLRQRQRRYPILERLEDRVVPSIADGTILVTTAPSPFASTDQSQMPIGIIGINPTTGAQTVISTGGLFSLPTYIAEAPNQQLYVTDLTAFGTGAVFRVDPNTGQQALVAKGQFINGPNAIAFVNGYLYVADVGDSTGMIHNVVRIDPATGKQTLVTDGSSGGFDVAVGMAPGPGNNIYLADEPGNFQGTDPGKLWEVNLDTGVQTVISSNNPTQGLLFDHPVDIAVDANGNIMVANTGGPADNVTGSVFRINPITGIQTRIITFGQYTGTDSIEIGSNGTIYVGDIAAGTNPGSIVMVNPLTGASTLLSSGGSISEVEGIRCFHANMQTTATTLALASSANPSVFGQNVTFTATITPSTPGTSTPTGTVQFVIDGTNAGSPVAVTSNGGIITSFSTASLTVGTHTVTASYSGDVSFSASSSTLSGGQTVSKAGTSTAVSSSVNPSVFGQLIAFTATINITKPGSGTPTGTVQFQIDGSNVGSPVTVNTTGGVTTATFSTANLAVGTHSVTAAYNGDGSFAASTGSLAGGESVAKAGTSTLVMSSVNPSLSGQNVTLTATLGVTSPGAGTPTGSVQFVIDGSNAGSPVNVNTAGGVTSASFSTANLAVGTHTIAASYTGDANFSGSNGILAGGQVVNKPAPTATMTTVSASANPAVFGQSVQFTATVSVPSPGTGTPTGTVLFMIDGNSAGSPVSLTTSGGVTTANFSTANLAVGTHTVTATYGGDANFATSAGTLTGGETIAKANTNTALTSSVNPSAFGQNVIFTAAITVTTPGAGTPTGAVQFIVDGSNAGNPVNLATSGGATTASFSSANLAVGTHTVAAIYSGDVNFASSTGTLTGGQTVAKAGTSTTVTSSVNPSVSGQNVTFTATIAITAPGAGTPTGTVQFQIDGSNSGGPVSVATTGGVTTAILSVGNLAIGVHTVTASYAGDAKFAASNGALSGGQVVNNKPATTVVVNSSADPSVFGQSVVFTAMITPANPSSGTPTGTVQFQIDGSNVGSPANVSTSGGATTASLTTAGLAIGTHSVTAIYAGDANFSGSTGTLSAGQTVAKASTNTTVSSSVNPSVSGQNVMFTATISVTAPGTGTPSGTVQFQVDGSNAGNPVSVVTFGGVTTAAFNTAGLAVGSHTITALYSGDSGFAASMGTLSGGQTVGKASTTTAVATSVNPSTSGQNITFTATIGVTSPGAGTPTGTVQFIIDGSNTGSPVNLSTSGGVATASFSTGSLTVGTHTVSASYTGDGTFTGSSAALAGGQVVNKPAPAATTITISSSANPAVFGQNIQFTATVSAANSANGTPTGTVLFMIDGNNAGNPVTLTTSGGVTSATFTTANLAVGTHTISASYGGDGNFASSNGTLSGGQTVAKAATAIALSSAVNPSLSGQNVTFTAAITVTAPGAGAPTGTVQFMIDGSNVGNPATVISGGGTITASFSTATLAVGTHTIAASYGGDGSFAASSSTSLNQTVAQAPTSTVVTSSANPSLSGQNVTFTASVSGSGTPTGTVQFVIDGTNAGNPVSLSATRGVPTATFATSGLTVGTHTVSAVYSGDTNFATSSGTLSGGQVVNNKPATTTLVSASSNPSVFGQIVVFTAVVSTANPGGKPTGTVQFAIDGSNVGSPVNLSTVGGVITATFSSATLAVGTHTVTATYGGDANFAGSLGTLTGGEMVAKASTTTTLMSVAPSVFGQNVTFTATIGVATPGAGTPTGTVQFMIDGSNSGSPVSLTTSGGVTTASFSTANLAVGTHTVAVVYSGDENFAGSTGTLTGGQTVGKASTTTMVATSVNPSTSGQNVLFTATIGVTTPGTGTPSGTVQFIVDGSNAGSPVNLSTSGGVATASFNTASLATGTHTIAATYSGDPSFSGSSGTLAGGQVVNSLTPTATITTLNASASSAVFGQNVQFTATVSVPSQGTGTPTGTVQFMIDGSNSGSPASLTTSGGVTTASFSGANLAVGTHTVVAIYSGDGNFASSTGTLAGGQTVAKAGTSTTVTSSVNPSVSGQNVTFTATIAITAPGAGTPTGTVQFQIDGSDAGSAVAVSTFGGVTTATLSTAGLAVGKHTITANYSGDSNFGSSTGTVSAGQTVGKASTSTTVVSSVNSSVSGQNVTFTATTSVAAPGAGTPTGTVQFVVDGSNAGSPVSVNTTGGVTTASFSTAAFSVSSHTVIASYSGDANFAASNSTPVNQAVGKAATSTAVGSSVNPSAAGQSTTFTATVAITAGAGIPTGTVQFIVDGSAAGSPVSVATSGGVTTASLSLASLSVGPHTVLASYSGDNNFAPSTSTAVTQTVGKTTVSTVLTSSANPSVLGQNITFTLAVAASGAGSGTPSGTVQFVIDNMNFGSPVNLSSGAATSAPVSSLALGNHTIKAIYSGDANFSGNTSTLTQTVNQASTTIAVTSSANPSPFGQGVSVTATVSVVAPGIGTPTGTVQFAIDGTNTGTPVSLSTTAGVTAAIFNAGSLPVGTYTITASYSGDSSFSSSISTAFAQTVGKASTSTAIVSSANASVFGQAVTFTATITTVGQATGTPTGTVQFQIDGTNFGSPATISSGVAISSAASNMSVGSHTITAIYSGDSTFAASTGTLAQVVNKAGTSTVVASSLNPSVSGQNVTFTATIGVITPGAGTPTGAVQFVVDGTNVGSPMGISTSGGVTTAAVTVPGLAVGTHTVSASYTGDGNFTGSSSAVAGGQVVNKPAATATTITISASPNPAVSGQSVQFTATVSAANSASGTPTGTVSFTIDGSNAGSPANLTTSGGVTTATFSIANFAVGTHTVTATYSGDANFATSAATLTGGETIAKANTATALISSVNPSVSGQNVTFTATISVNAPGAGTPSGTVQFMIDGSAAGSPVNVSTSGGTAIAVFRTSTLAVGNHAISAVYSGDSGFVGSTSTPLTQTVAKADTSTAVLSSANPSVSGQGVTFTATVTAAGQGSGTLTGTVQFQIDGTNFGSPVSITNGVAASGVASSLSVGSHTIKAIYSGDASFNSSTGTLTQTSSQASTSITVASSAQSSVSGQSVSFTATIAIVSPGTGAPTGTVQFVIDGSNAGGPVSLSTVGGVTTASYTTASLAVGTHTVRASYNGDANSLSSTSNSITLTVSKDATSTTLSSSISPATFGQAVTFTAAVTATAPGGGTPTGSVQFQIDGSNFGAPVNLVNGAATSSSISSLSAAAHAIKAIYSGDTNFVTSTATFTQNINQGHTTTTLTSPVSSSVYGQNITLTATVSVTAPGVGTPTGTVQFVVDGSNSGSPVNVSTIGGRTTASFNTASLPVGTHTITALYKGDSGLAGSTSNAIMQTVGKANTSTLVLASTNPSIFGQSLTFTATVKPSNPGGGIPTGTVQFQIDGTNFGSPVNLNSSGAAVSLATSLSVASHTIKAVYSGDLNFTSSTGTLAPVVNKASTTTAVTSSLNPSTAGQNLTFTATISVTAPGSGTPTGTVQFQVDGSNVGSPIGVNTSAGLTTAAFSIATLSAGTHTIVARYSGDGSFTNSNSSVFTQTVNKASTTTTVVSSLNPSVLGQGISFTAAVAGSQGSGTPTGTVQFQIDGMNFGNPVSLKSGVAVSAATSSLSVADHTIRAVYSGDVNFTSSFGTFAQTVHKASTSTTIGSSANPSLFGQSVTFTATIAVTAPGAGTPSGTVQFVIDGTSAGDPVRVSTTAGVTTASFSIASLAVGAHTVVASYSGDSNFAPSDASLSGGQIVGQAGVTVAVTSSASPSVFGQAVTFTATVAADSTNGGTPTGTVQFQIDGTNFGGPVTLTNGVATSDPANDLSVATHTISAIYSGDATFATSHGSLDQIVSQASASTTVASSVDPSVFGQPVTFTATVTATSPGGGTPTGSVQFMIDGTNFGDPVSLSGGVATTTASGDLSTGDHTIQAVYSGDANFSTSSGSLTQTVNQTAGVLVIAGFPSPITAGVSGSFTVTVEDTSGNTVSGYLGTIHFTSTDGLASLPADYTFTAADNGVHTFSAVFETAGSQSLSATDTLGGFTGTQAGITVTPAAADHLSVTPSVGTTPAGAPFDITVTVQDAYNNTVADYTGTVMFSSGDPYGASLPEAYSYSAADGGVHTFSGGAVLHTAGTQNITAVDSANPALTGSALITVTPAAVDHFAVIASVSTAVAGTPFDVTVVVQDPYNNTVTDYTGTVIFSSGDPYGASLPSSYTFSGAEGGVQTFPGSATLYTVGVWDLTVADSANPALTGSTDVLITPAAASHFVILAPPSATAGSPFGIEIEAVDPYGNVDTNYVTDPSGVVHLGTTDLDPEVGLPGDFQFTPADQGMIFFPGGVTLFTPGDQTLTAIDTVSGLTDDGSAIVTITPPGGGGAAPRSSGHPHHGDFATEFLPISISTVSMPVMLAGARSPSHAKEPQKAELLDHLFADEASGITGSQSERASWSSGPLWDIGDAASWSLRWNDPL